jgi:hypothetical protein
MIVPVFKMNSININLPPQILRYDSNLICCYTLIAVILHGGQFFSQFGNIWQCLEPFLVVTTGMGHKHAVDRGQRCRQPTTHRIATYTLYL